MTRTLSVKHNALVEELNNPTILTLDHFERIGKINRLLDEQSESSSNGLVPNLESLYKHLKSLPYALEQLHNANRSENIKGMNKEMTPTDQMKPDKLYYQHLELEQEANALAIGTKGDSMNFAMTKVTTPWLAKASVIRAELEEADIIRDALESAQAEIKHQQKELVEERRKTAKINNTLDVVKAELAKQHVMNQDLYHYEVEAKSADQKLLKYVTKNKELKTQRDALLASQNELESQLKSYQNTLQSMKQKTKKNHITRIDNRDDEDDDDDHSVPGSAVSRKSLHRRGGSLNLTPRLSGKSMNMNTSTISNGPNGGGGGADLGLFRLGKHSPANDGSYDGMSMSMSMEPDNTDHQMVSSLQKQLELNKQYNGLLERTVNSLRHSHNVYDLKKQWIEMRRELKPLPAFTSMTDLQYKQYVERSEHLRQREEMKRLQRKRRREKLVAKKAKRMRTKKSEPREVKAAFSLSPSPTKLRKPQTLSVPHSQSASDRSEDSEDVDIDDVVEDMKMTDDSEAEMTGNVMSSFEQKVLRKERYRQIERSLTDLNGRFGAIYSAPKMIDLTKKELGVHQQTEIGRSIKLRDLAVQCVELTKQCREIESTFQSHTVHGTAETQSSRKELVAVGRVDLPVNDGGNTKRETKVCLNRSNVLKLQNYLLNI